MIKKKKVPIHSDYLDHLAKEFGFETVGRHSGFLSGQIEVSSGSSLCSLDKVWRGWKSR